MEQSRTRISITLSPSWLDFLRWWSAECATLPAELARHMLEASLEQARARPGVAERFQMWRTGRQVEDECAEEIVAALCTPGVPAVLSGDGALAANGAAQAAAFLVELSTWLVDPRGAGEKPPRPRLGSTPACSPASTDVGAALDAAGGADGATARRARASGVPLASDKRQLSDMAPARPQGTAHVQS